MHSYQKYNLTMMMMPILIASKINFKSLDFFRNFFQDRDKYLEQSGSNKYLNIAKTIPIRVCQRNALSINSDDTENIDYCSLKKIPLMIQQEGREDSVTACQEDPFPLGAVTQDQVAVLAKHGFESNNQDGKQSVIYEYVDFSPVNFAKRLQILRTAELRGTGQNESTSEYEIAHFCESIMKKTDGMIEDQRLIRNIIDSQFNGGTRRYMIIGMVITLIFDILFVAQILLDNEQVVLYCNYVCVSLILGFYLAIELLQVMEASQSYFSSMWNMIDMVFGVIYLVYFSIRISNTQNFLPMSHVVSTHTGKKNAYKFDKDYAKTAQQKRLHELMPVMCVFHLVIVFLGVIKLQFYLRFNNKFGFLVVLITECFQDIIQFLVFFAMWTITGALFF